MADTNRKGDLGEILAVAWLWMRGYEVFRNTGCTGPIDLVAVDAVGETHLIDVKTVYKEQLYGPVDKQPTEQQKGLGVKLLFVNPRTGECRWTYNE